MKILSAAQVRQWDEYTITNEPIRSIDLMERAALACYKWITDKFKDTDRFVIFCGTGNNGGDGLALARLLLEAGKLVTIYILEGTKRSIDFSANLKRLDPQLPVQFITANELPIIKGNLVIIDALFGTGLTRPLDMQAASLVSHINESGKTVIAIDLPSGLLPDKNSPTDAVIKADHTLSFQIPKLAFMMTETGKYTGYVHLLDIGLHPNFYDVAQTQFHTAEIENAVKIYKPRNQFKHKYDFGHALLYAGSKNMMGAAILCAKACLKTGAGLVTVYTEEETQAAIQISLPEAITSDENNVHVLSKKKAAIGIGPGVSPSLDNEILIRQLISEWNGPLIIDATGLHLLAENQRILVQRKIHPAILTPHTGEFDRLFGSSSNDFDRLEKAINKAKMLNCYIVLKGPHTLLACPDGNAYFNTSGNAGMATAGSGDVLTGILTGLLSLGYPEKKACILGVYLHGLAGDIAAEKKSQEAMIASDIIDSIGEAYKKIRGLKLC